MLTNDECREVYNAAMALPDRSIVVATRYIEVAILAKLRGGGVELPEPDMGTITIHAKKPPVSMGYSIEAMLDYGDRRVTIARTQALNDAANIDPGPLNISAADGPGTVWKKYREAILAMLGAAPNENI